MVKEFHGNFRSKTLGYREIKTVFRDVKWCLNASWGLKGLNNSNSEMSLFYINKYLSPLEAGNWVSNFGFKWMKNKNKLTLWTFITPQSNVLHPWEQEFQKRYFRETVGTIYDDFLWFVTHFKSPNRSQVTGAVVKAACLGRLRSRVRPPLWHFKEANVSPLVICKDSILWVTSVTER